MSILPHRLHTGLMAALVLAGAAYAGQGGPSLLFAFTPAPSETEAAVPQEPAPLFETADPGDGENIAENVIFQECGTTPIGAYCAVHGAGRKLFVYEDGRTATEVLDFLRAQEPGTPLAVVGQVTKKFAGGASLAMELALPRAAGPNDRVLHQLQGHWYAAEDANAQFSILGAERQNVFQGAVSDIEFLSVQDRCADFAGKGPYLHVFEPDTGEDQCFAIDSIDTQQMTLIFLPRGNFLQYKRLK